METTVPPKLIRSVLVVALILGVVTLLYYGRAFLVPLTFAGILAALVNPIDNKLRGWGWNRYLAITGAMMTIILFFTALFVAVGHQAYKFVENWSEIQNRLIDQLNAIAEQLGIEQVVPQLTSGSGEGSGGPIQDLPAVTQTLGGILSGSFGVAGDFLLMLVYVVLLLSQKERLREFILRRMPDEDRGDTHRTLNESQDIVQKYLRGRLILIGILTVLYSIGFFIIDLNYAIFIALLVAILSIIPYLGNIIGGAIAIAISFASGGGTSAMWGILITMAAAQMLESYILTPLIVGDEVDINPLTTILCVIGMTFVWGAVGAIVAIPLTAILRIVFSHVKGLQDYAFVLGQEKF